jgi:hypothetical protein
MQLRFGRSHFDFLAECFVLPGERGLLEERMEEEPGSWWIVKPPGGPFTQIHLIKWVPGKNNGAGIYLISSPSEAPRSEEEVCHDIFRLCLILPITVPMALSAIFQSIHPFISSCRCWCSATSLARPLSMAASLT